MSYEVRLPPEVMQQIAVLPSKVQRQVRRHIDALAANPRPAGAETLVSRHKGLMRVRSGDYRIVYQVRDEDRRVLLLKVGHRRDVYRGL